MIALIPEIPQFSNQLLDEMRSFRLWLRPDSAQRVDELCVRNSSIEIVISCVVFNQTLNEKLSQTLLCKNALFLLCSFFVWISELNCLQKSIILRYLSHYPILYIYLPSKSQFTKPRQFTLILLREAIMNYSYLVNLHNFAWICVKNKYSNVSFLLTKLTPLSF